MGMRLIIKEENSLKSIIKDELNKLLREQQEKVIEDKPQKIWQVEIAPQDFLNLAEKSYGDDVETRSQLGTFQKHLSGNMLLVVDPNTGEITSHAGRARAQLAAKSNLSKIKIQIKIDEEKFPPIAWSKLPNTFYQQSGGGNTVSKNKLQLLEIKADRSDLLYLGDEEIVFKDVISKAGEKLPSGAIRQEDYKRVDATSEAEIMLQKVYSDLYDLLRKERGWAPEDYKHHDEVADEADDVLKNNFIIEDEKGPLEAKVRRGYYRVKFTRVASPPIKIKKK